MNDDGRVHTPETASLDWEFKAGSESLAQAGRLKIAEQFARELLP
jgi:hypothetical protein